MLLSYKLNYPPFLHHVCLQELLIDQLVFQTYLADLFSKMNDVSLSLQGKQLIVFVALVIFELARKKRIWKTISRIPLPFLFTILFAHGEQLFGKDISKCYMKGAPRILPFYSLKKSYFSKKTNNHLQIRKW